jgi:hypothetical protein
MTRARDIASSGGMVLISTTTIGSGVTSIPVDNVFSSAYRNYQIVINGLQTGTIDGYLMQLRDSTGTIAGTGYHFSGLETQSTSSTLQQRLGAGVNSIRIGVGSGTNASASYNFIVNVYNPFLTQGTNLFASSTTNARGAIGNVYTTISGSLEGATSCHGFNLFMSGSGVTITGGSIQVYGLRN